MPLATDKNGPTHLLRKDSRTGSSKFAQGDKKWSEGDSNPDLLDANESTCAFAGSNCVDSERNQQLSGLTVLDTESPEKFRCVLVAY